MPEKLPPVSRRSFLATGAAAAAAISAPAAARAARPEIRRRPAPRNLIFLVSDGMSAGTFSMADLLLQQTQSRRSHWWNLTAREGSRRTVVETASANSLVTDSAAASTAWSIGERVFSGAIGHTPDGRTPEPILHRAKRAGKATGLVTTTTLSHATPAGWACNVTTGRGDEAGIAKNMMSRNYDLLLGGGRRHYTDETLALGTGYTRVFSRDELIALPDDHTGRLVGVFNRGHLSYSLDRRDDEPTLAEMTGTAIKRLARNPDGFVLQVEGGRVDHAAHANDAGSLIHDQIAFDDALGVALAFAENRDDTLIIATTDHANANPGLTQYLRNGSRNFLRIAEWKHSFEWMNRQIAPTERTAEDHRRVIFEATNIELSDDELATVMRWRSGERVIPFYELNKDHGPLGSVLSNHNGVGFISGNHTADHVEQTAFGPGADAMPPAMHLADATPILAGLLDLPPALASL